MLVAPRLVGKILAAVVAVVLFVLLGTATLVWWTARQDDRRPSDVIVVLGAAQFDGRPSSVFTARLVHARNLWREEVAPRIVTVGGNQEGDRFTEAESGKQWLAENGVPEGRITAVETGNDTLSSLEAVKRQMDKSGWDTAVVVTDPWHALRTGSMANGRGIDAVVSPTRRGPAVRTRATELRYIARETFAFLYWKIFNRSSDSGPNAV